MKKEHFKIFIRGTFWRSHEEGKMLPRFFLPVWRPADKYGIECWVFYLAPFILIYRISSNIFWILWRDLLDWQKDIADWAKLKAKQYSLPTIQRGRQGGTE